ncbi:MAG: hypothetical protein MI919_43440, partial [Holophagales bacterium]|nr:hypothetical protein [Holophagales bacterium]
MGLLVAYRPTLAEARLSLIELREATPFGFLRDLHLWASHGLLIAAFLHLLRVFALGSYRRVLGWSATVALTLLAVLAAWTGSHLPEPRAGEPVLLFWVAHVLLLPLLAGGVIWFWWRRREGAP